MSLSRSLRRVIEQQCGESIRAVDPCGGGCIAQSFSLEFTSGLHAFLKYYSSGSDIAVKEVRGLQEINRSQTVSVPRVLACDNEWLLLEYIEPGQTSPAFFERLGDALATMHRTSHSTFGFEQDNYIGATPQINRPDGTEQLSWLDFYHTKRLLFQIKRAENNGYADRQLLQLFIQFENVLPGLLAGTEESPALLHGDLWSGNVIAGKDSMPWLIDPAVYYGHREAELAMTLQFGGFSDLFYESYNRSFSLIDGWRERMGIYKLYHVLNHLNLFGRGYYADACSLMSSYCR